jgi:hypothetical protein
VALYAGGVTLALVGACTAFAWVDDAPLVPVEGGRLVGDPAWAWAFLVCAGVALATYAVGLALLRRRAARTAAVVALAVAIQATPLFAPLLLSSDAWTYWSYGRIAAVHGGNPYREPPSAYPEDPSFPWVGADWRDTTSVYAPAFTLASEPAALAAGESHDRAAWIFKALAAAAMVAASLLAARLAARPAFAGTTTPGSPGSCSRRSRSPRPAAAASRASRGRWPSSSSGSRSSFCRCGRSRRGVPGGTSSTRGRS